MPHAASLDELRKSVLFQNSVDVWIAACTETKTDWHDADGYRKFVRYLRDNSVSLQKYSLCVSDSESTDKQEREKAEFAKSLSENDLDGATYTIRLSDSAVSKIRSFWD